LLGAAGALVAATMLGAAFLPYLAVHQPLVLLALNPWPRHQLLVAPTTPMLPFLAVIVARTLVSCALGYELALRYGPSILERFTQGNERAARFLSTLERWFRRAAVPVLIVAPGPLTAAFGALFGMRRWVVFPCMALGQLGLSYVNYRLGGLIAPWTKPILDFIARNIGPATAVCVIAVLAYQWFSRRRKRRHAQGMGT
jgi:membrane protein DedA with SNARE-associated domain